MLTHYLFCHLQMVQRGGVDNLLRIDYTNANKVMYTIPQTDIGLLIFIEEQIPKRSYSTISFFIKILFYCYSQFYYSHYKESNIKHKLKVKFYKTYSLTSVYERCHASYYINAIFRAFSNIFSNILNALCRVYIIIPINVGPRNKRGVLLASTFQILISTIRR